MRGLDSPTGEVPADWQPQRVDVEVWGGLGNRLFMLSAGFILARRLRKPLRILTHRAMPLAEIVGGLDTEALFAAMPEPPEVAVLSKTRHPMATRAREKFRNLRGSAPLAPRERLHGGRIRCRAGQRAESLLVQGYFQSLHTTLSAVDLGWPTQVPMTPADAEWARGVIDGARPIGLHVRRGDYLQPINQRRLGGPTCSYYQAALDRLQFRQGDTTWLFSDDTASAHAFLADSHLPISRAFGPADSPSEGAALGLMASVPGLIVSNSTFAWWAAFWGAHRRGVVYPQPWHDRVDATSLPSPGWIPVPKNDGLKSNQFGQRHGEGAG